MKIISTVCVFLLMLYSCNVTKRDGISNNAEKIFLPGNISLTWGTKDTSISSYDGSANGIFGRMVIYRDSSGLQNKSEEDGTINCIVCINKEGIVEYAAIVKSQSTINDSTTLKNCLLSAKEYRFQPKTDAPNLQCGKLQFLIENQQGLSLGLRDSTILDDNYDMTGDGVFGRKIIYRDLSALKFAVNESGSIAVKVCINRTGIVTYVELLPSETTIKDKEVLKRYLKAASGYKFQSLNSAPAEQCGKMKFIISNSINRKF